MKKYILSFEEFLNEGQMKDATRWDSTKHKEFHDAKKRVT